MRHIGYQGYEQLYDLSTNLRNCLKQSFKNLNKTRVLFPVIPGVVVYSGNSVSCSNPESRPGGLPTVGPKGRQIALYTTV